MGKVIDIVKDKPRDELEAFKRWQNRWQSEMISNSRYSKKIAVTDGTEDLCGLCGLDISALCNNADCDNRKDYFASLDEDRFQQDGQ